MNYVAYYLDRGFELNYLLNLTELEKLFFIESMNYAIDCKVQFEESKLKAILGEGGKNNGK